jgi:hypothetical protein
LFCAETLIRVARHARGDAVRKTTGTGAALTVY